MTITSTCHNHCTMCDGASTADEMINAAILAGFTDFGMSCHSYAAFDLECSVRDEGEYLAAMRILQKEYAGVINVAVGVEQDMLAPVKSRSAYDYIIGSVHYLYDGHSGVYYTVDDNAEKLKKCIDEMFDGSAMDMVKAFYAASVKNVREYEPDVIGHFDLVTKLNEGKLFFDENSTEYKNTALDALELCAQSGKIFEINTGGMYRGAINRPYPAPFLLGALHEMNAKITVNADAHCTDAIAFGLADAVKLAKDTGFKSVYLLKNGKFAEIGI